MSYAPTIHATADALAFFRVLADDTRLTIVRLLALTDLRAGELVALNWSDIRRAEPNRC